MKLLSSLRAAKEKAKHKEAQKAAKVRREWSDDLVPDVLRIHGMRAHTHAHAHSVTCEI